MDVKLLMSALVDEGFAITTHPDGVIIARRGRALVRVAEGKRPVFAITTPPRFAY